MLESDEFLSWPVYDAERALKRSRLEPALQALTRHHAAACADYGRLLAAYGIAPDAPMTLEQLPFVPVRLFKHRLLSSVSPEQVFKTLTSSGTTGQAPSRIVLDKLTAQRQTTALARIMQNFLGPARLPMLIVDHPGVIKDRHSFSARGAGILGLSNLGRQHVYALRDDMSLDLEALRAFAERHRGQPKLAFGFTFMVWQHFAQALRAAGERVDLSGLVLIHSGGWKKLVDQAVDNATFKARLRDLLGDVRIHNFYGMVEQVGSVFVECEQGYLHAPAFADVLVRDATDWSVLPPGREGLLQVLSCLPHSYPGHSLLTEDRGVLLGEDDCPCGRRGRYFHVHGRLPRAELRGCSDTQPGLAAQA
ncbi:acyl-protein synthetase [Pelomonas cellulosilytica]|uniref:Acyl-protein synthetase n=1 Tax=Pelomonas cellulosilytica TaxID=2906762 RepID=A0ABS8XZR7_9BURK|nr:acyl-protein synthetase [Pelomonas sp. P8]MCE4556116.1 acyl-protein synthetase [Pelomonas sp. P8]